MNSRSFTDALAKIGANALAMQLLKKKQNGSLKKIKDLKNKIDARL